eukprot:TRINITY_DN11074_c0_g1_i3.p1 TRINITY_DN11074_c0_g1~~TRINITY_DN11074_c0_g1_i3.p1  ORF type:complete len:548 (-),score=93.20 TRINITY_DN11074_c0_g1_i3:268-1911(-)
MVAAYFRAVAGAVSLVSLAQAKDAFVFCGATGDNALRPAGIWSGLFEAWAGGVFNEDTYSLHVAMNTPHTVDELHKDVILSLTPLYEQLKGSKSWQCHTKDGNCSPVKLLEQVQVNIWAGRDADAQAKNMSASLAEASKVTVYLSLPPFVFGSWSTAAVKNWGNGPQNRVHIAVEKPFGTSVENADKLYADILSSGVPEQNLHLVDHWLSFFMNRHLPDFRSIVEKALGIEFSSKDIAKIVVTEFEERGLQGRAEFFDGVGQVRDMVQSHLLQVMSLVLLDPAAKSRSEGKLQILNNTELRACRLGQYDGWLMEPKLSYHASFADSTLCSVDVLVNMPEWTGVDFTIQTGKSMGATVYTVEILQRAGPGKITYSIGKEETGVASINVTSWPLKDASPVEIPTPGFGGANKTSASPRVDASGTGTLFEYNDEQMYFPAPYANMIASLFGGEYGYAFVTYPECHRSWQVVNASNGACLDPKPELVEVYQPPSTCGHQAPRICTENKTVSDEYTKALACSAEHDKQYANTSIYQAKCHPKPQPNEAVIVI